MGVIKVDNFSNIDKDKEASLDNADLVQAEDSQELNPSRRRFTRNGFIGSAVILSLGSRAAWGQTAGAECLSVATWGSYVDGGMEFASLQPGNQQKSDIADTIRDADFVDFESSPGYACPGQAEAPSNQPFTGPLNTGKGRGQGRDQGMGR